MIARIRHWLHRRALQQINTTIDQILEAALMAYLRGDLAAGRYFDAELQLATARRAALLGDPNPGRYCCDGHCERQGRENCARPSPFVSSTTT